LVQTRGGGGGPGGGGLYFVDLREDTSYEIYEFAQAGGNGGAEFSPDGSFVAYESRETGESEVFVKSFPNGDGRSQVSTQGGQHPRWNSAGDELFYVEGTTIMSVPIELGDRAEIGDPTPLFTHPSLTRGRGFKGFGVSPEGDRFALVEPDMEPRPPTIEVVLNWLELAPGS
jgi:Tol biopolymer transport system component